MKKYLVLSFIAALLIACAASEKEVEVLVSNPLSADRTHEIVELSRRAVVEKLGLNAGETFVITDAASVEIPYQIAANLHNEADSLLIFPATVKANGQSVYTIKKGSPERVESGVYGRLVPERKDDFTWENDKIAFRVYGPALQATGEISSGIDVWAKRTDKMVIDRWYADELGGKSSYHTDNGEGLDFYKVGPTLGAGAAAPFINDSIWYSQNFTDYEVLDNGPLRITVRYRFAPYKADKTEVRAARAISLDVGSQLNKITYTYGFDGAELPVVSGVVIRNQPPDEVIHIDTENNYATYKEPTDSVNGTLYTAIVWTKPPTAVETEKGHILGFQTVTSGEPYIYFAGGGWSKGGFATYADWNQYVAGFSEKQHNPLKVELK